MKNKALKNFNSHKMNTDLRISNVADKSEYRTNIWMQAVQDNTSCVTIGILCIPRYTDPGLLGTGHAVKRNNFTNILIYINFFVICNAKHWIKQ